MQLVGGWIATTSEFQSPLDSGAIKRSDLSHDTGAWNHCQQEDDATRESLVHGCPQRRRLTSLDFTRPRAAELVHLSRIGSKLVHGARVLARQTWRDRRRRR